MGTSWGQVVKQEGKNFPGLAEYTKCQSTVFAYSTLTMVTVSIGTYSLLQNKKFKKVEMKHKVLASICLGGFCAWYLARTRTRYCQELWTVLDKKKEPVPAVETEETEAEKSRN